MLKRSCQFLLGLNGASMIRGLRLGLREFINSCFTSFSAVYPFQDRRLLESQKLLKAIPTRALGEILNGKKALIKLQVQKYEEGMMPSYEAMSLLSILVVEKPREILEIGTFMGHTSKAMSENLNEAIIHTVDLPLDFSPRQKDRELPPKDDFQLIERRIVGREFKGQAIESRIRQHFGDTATIDFHQFGKSSAFFIDGSHTYEYCRQDSEKCYELCGGSGVFLWHDCDIMHPGILRFVCEWRAMGRNIVLIEGTTIAYWKTP